MKRVRSNVARTDEQDAESTGNSRCQDEKTSSQVIGNDGEKYQSANLQTSYFQTSVSFLQDRVVSHTKNTGDGKRIVESGNFEKV